MWKRKSSLNYIYIHIYIYIYIYVCARARTHITSHSLLFNESTYGTICVCVCVCVRVCGRAHITSHSICVCVRVRARITSHSLLFNESTYGTTLLYLVYLFIFDIYLRYNRSWLIEKNLWQLLTKSLIIVVRKTLVESVNSWNIQKKCHFIKL